MPLSLKDALRRKTRSRAELDAACDRLVAMNEQTLRWQIAVTEIAAPTGAEATRAAWMSARLCELGWSDVRSDAAGNVIARRDGARVRVADGAGAVWCCAHLDTVFEIDAPHVRRSGARLSGPGIGDNGRGLAAVLALADALHATQTHTPREIVIACTTGEEGLGDLRGMQQLMRDATPTPHAVIAIDGAGDDRVVNAALGSTRWRVTFRGAGGHSWAHFGAVNPVHAVGALTAALNGLLLPKDPRTTLTVARIGGGESINSIPRDGWIEVDIRSVSADVLTDMERHLRDAIDRVTRAENARKSRDSAELTAELVQIGNRPCGVLPASAPLVQLALQVTRGIGAPAHLAVGSTDASVPIAMGIPAIAIGAGGRGDRTHTPDEWYDDTNGVTGLQRVLRIVAGAAGLH